MFVYKASVAGVFVPFFSLFLPCLDFLSMKPFW